MFSFRGGQIWPERVIPPGVLEEDGAEQDAFVVRVAIVSELAILSKRWPDAPPHARPIKEEELPLRTDANEATSPTSANPTDNSGAPRRKLPSSQTNHQQRRHCAAPKQITARSKPWQTARPTGSTTTPSARTATPNHQTHASPRTAPTALHATVLTHTHTHTHTHTPGHPGTQNATWPGGACTSVRIVLIICIFEATPRVV